MNPDPFTALHRSLEEIEWAIDSRNGEVWFPRPLPIDASPGFKAGWYSKEKAYFDRPEGAPDA